MNQARHGEDKKYWDELTPSEKLWALAKQCYDVGANNHTVILKGLAEEAEGMETRLEFTTRWAMAEYTRARTLWGRAVWRDEEYPDQPMLSDGIVACIIADEMNSAWACHHLALLENAEREADDGRD